MVSHTETFLELVYGESWRIPMGKDSSIVNKCYGSFEDVSDGNAEMAWYWLRAVAAVVSMIALFAYFVHLLDLGRRKRAVQVEA